MGAAVVGLQRFGKDRAPYEKLTAKDWITKRMGRHAWEQVWGPLLRGKFGDRAEQIAMVWLWSKFTLRRSIKGEEATQEKLGYPGRSWEPLFEELQRRIEAGGGRVLIDRPVVRIAPEGSKWKVVPGAEGSFRKGHDPSAFDPLEAETYDAVLSTLPNDIFAKVADLPAEYEAKLHSIEYFAALCLLLELDRQFSPFYWTNVADRELPFVGLIEHTNFVEPERYDGRRFLYVANYLEHGHPWLEHSADELLDVYEAGLKKVNPGFSRDWIKQSWLFREPAAQPIVTVGYHERIPPLQTGLPGLILANTTQVYPEDRGTNYAVRLGDDAARELLASYPAASR
jgi:protoporphyrinogen oxidase